MSGDIFVESDTAKADALLKLIFETFLVADEAI